MMVLRLPSVRSIESARDRICHHVIRSPLIQLNTSSLKNQIYLKLENLQPTGSFKIRAATNALLSLPEDDLAHGVVTTSTGNFGRALATIASIVGTDCTAIVPDTSSRAKIDALESAGASVNIVPFKDWWQMLEKKSTGGLPGTFVSPIAGQEVMEGNGTIALEILDELPAVDSVFVPVGGGGLVSGISAVFRDRKPDVEIVACETDTSLPVQTSLRNGRPTVVEHTPIFVDGIGGRSVVEQMWPVVQQAVDRCTAVSIASVVKIIRQLVTDHHFVAEGAGAVSVAAALAEPGKGRTFVCIVSGGNLAPDKLAAILQGQTPKMG